MQRLATVTVLCLMVIPATLSGQQPGTPNKVVLNGHTFTLPPGFGIELAAKSSLVDRPISAAFDERGRLYVTVSSGSNANGPTQAKEQSNRIVRLEDTNGDGVFDKAITFADKLALPEGAMWYNGSLYVAAPPHILKFTDTDDDGKADRREIWFDGKTVTGCANDLHGPYLGPDGWIYWCKGAWALQTYTVGDKEFKTRASHVFRATPDGKNIEPVITGGMDNPVGLAFTPTGEMIVSGTFFQFPAGGKRDGLIHAVYGGIYGKDHEPIHDPVHKWTSPEVLPIMTHLGAAAPCGLIRFESEAFGSAYKDNLFCCLFNMQKVTRHVLVPDGSTFKTQDSDFLVSDQKDFHPTDVIEDADGSLLVVDTGGWYKICCPTSQLAMPDVLGAIYRVYRKQMPGPDDPRGLKLAWGKMNPWEEVRLLHDPRPAVRRRAAMALSAREPGAEDERPANFMRHALGSDSPTARLEAVRAASMTYPQAGSALQLAVLDSDLTVRQAALHSMSVHRNSWRVFQPQEWLKSRSPQQRRLAAEYIGRAGRRDFVQDLLLMAAGEPCDRFLEHSITYALIELADDRATVNGLRSENEKVRRVALMALEQMDDFRFSAPVVIPMLISLDLDVRAAAWWVAGRHPEWGDQLAEPLRGCLMAKIQSPKIRTNLATLLARYAHGRVVQQMMATSLRDRDMPTTARQVVLRGMAQANLKETPAAWVTAVTDVLGGDNADLTVEALATVQTLRLPKQAADGLTTTLRKLGTDANAPVTVRLRALVAVPGGLQQVEPALFDFLRSRLGNDCPVAERGAAADVLARAKLDAAQLTALIDTFKTVGPMEADRLLGAFAQSADDKVGLSLLAALKSSPVKSGLRAATLRNTLDKYGPAVRQEVAVLYESLNVDAGKQRARLDELMAHLKDGDVRRGHAVFNSPKAACVSCHAIGYLGGTVGPDLTHIGRIRTDRDLLEAVVFPSVSFVRGYEPVVVSTRDGKLYNGVVRKDGADELILATGPDQQVRLPREDVEEVRPSQVSVMPAGLDGQLTPAELADLVAFLRACK